MTAEYAKDGNLGILTLGGELTHENSDGLVSRFRMWHLREPSQRYIVDLARITLIDSSGVGALVTCLHHVRGSGSDLCLAGATGKARMVLDITNLDRVFKVYDSVEQARTAG